MLRTCGCRVFKTMPVQMHDILEPLSLAGEDLFCVFICGSCRKDFGCHNSPRPPGAGKRFLKHIKEVIIYLAHGRYGKQ